MTEEWCSICGSYAYDNRSLRDRLRVETEIDRLRAENASLQLLYDNSIHHGCTQYELDRLRARNAVLEDALKMIVAGGYDEASRVFAAEVAARALAP